MEILHLILLLFYFICSVKSRYIIFSSTSQTWFSANQKCKTEYNGSLADIDEIKEGSNNRKFTTCLNGSDELWTGELLYTTGYIAYKGCYNVPDSFHHDSVSMEEMTIAKCQLKCRYDKGFAIKDKYCKCIDSGYLLQQYTLSNLTDCSFICSGQYCGFYGGNNSAGLYVENITGHALQMNNYSPSELCLVSKCVKPSTGALRIQYEQSRCDKQSGISVYCENGVTRNYFSSWNDAMAYCVGYRSHLITINNSNCKYGSRMWCNERKYQEIIRAKGFSVTANSKLSCIYTNVTHQKKSLTDCFRYKNFACVTDDSVSGKCVFTLNESKIEFETSTSSSDRNVLSTSISPYLPQNNSTVSIGLTSSDNSVPNNNTYGRSKAGNDNDNDKKIIIGITVGITCVTAAAILTFIIYWKRNGCVQIKRKSAANASTETTFVSASSPHKRSKEHKDDGGKTPVGYFCNKQRDAPKGTEASYNDCFESDNSEQADQTYCGLGERTESNYDVIIKEKRRQSENYEIPMSKRLYENVTIK